MSDPYFNHVVLLCNLQGADAATTTTEEALNAAVTFNGNAQLDTAQAPSGCSSSLLLDGTGDFISVPHTTLHNVGAVGLDWTFEAYIRINATGRTHTIFNKRATAGAAQNVSMSVNATQNLVFSWWYSGSSASIVSSSTLSTGQWYHVACVRENNWWYMYINGVQVANAQQTATVLSSTQIQCIGRDAFSTARDFLGWIGPCRITRGVARYKNANGSFTPPSVPFPEGGGSGVAIARKSRRISPLDPYYDATVALLNFNMIATSVAQPNDIPDLSYAGKNRGRQWGAINTIEFTKTKYKTGVASARIGSADGFNTVALALDPTYLVDFWIEKDYTMEFWVNFDSAIAADVLAAMRETPAADNAWKFVKNADASVRFIAWNNSTPLIDITTPAGVTAADQWHHIAMSRHKTTWRIFVDGTNQAEGIETASPIYYDAGGVRLFRDIVTTSSDYFLGYCDSLRFTKGVARYTRNFSVPNRRFPERGP